MYANGYLKIFDVDSKLLDERKKWKDIKNIWLVFIRVLLTRTGSSIVYVNLKHEIIYMNPAAVNSYAKRGGDKLIGRSLLDCHKSGIQG